MTDTDIERGLAARYIARVLERGNLPLRTTRYIVSWINERTESLALPLPRELSKAVGDIYSTGFIATDFERAYRRCRDRVLDDLRSVADGTPRPQPLANNVEILTRELGLSRAAWKIVGLVACYTRFDQVEYLCDCITSTVSPISRVVALMVGEPPRVVEQLISPTGELVTSGLLSVQQGDNLAGSGGRFTIPPNIDACLDQVYENFGEMRQTLLGEPLNSSMEAMDYDHVSADRDLMTRVIAGANEEGVAGINILLFGPPGTGKTELCKVAAREAGAILYSSGEDLGYGGESDRSERLSNLSFCLKLLGESKNTALLFDEMEDIAWQLMRRGGSKVYLNRLLERNRVPVLWTSNNIHEIDPALLRRMTLAIELKLPPATQRERILKRLAERMEVDLTDSDVAALSRRVDAAPAVLENALRAARLSGGGAAAVERAALGIVRAVSGVTARKPAHVPKFYPKLFCASMNLQDLTDQLVKGEGRKFSLCLSGPPGTGKSAYARHLAGSLELEVLQKRASDLLGAFVGESEKRIADAFEEALDSNAFLVFDEADSLLFDRTQAVRSWEVTQVNEMLTWMEEHPLPVCFTTNLMDRMDSASLRRFTFHVQFEYLNKTALRHAFEVFFSIGHVSGEALALSNLTPGDFAQARKQADVLGIRHDVARVTELLTKISRTKPGASGNIGFLN